MFFIFLFRVGCFLFSIRMIRAGRKALSYKITHQGENAYVSLSGTGFPSYVDAVWLGRIYGGFTTLGGLIGVLGSVFYHHKGRH